MIRLDDTSGGAIAAAIATERTRMGTGATGMVLTLLIVATEAMSSAATDAAVAAARSHPMRILTLIPQPDVDSTGLDARVMVGGEDGPGEVVRLHLRGALAEHANSVAVPLLLPDTPVVAFWPGACPESPAHDLIGRHAQRRITNAAATTDQVATLDRLRQVYVPGDTDLAWARLTPWRSALAAVLDQPVGPVTGVHLHGPGDDASVRLLSTWLRDCLGQRVTCTAESELTCVELHAHDGVVRIERTSPSAALLRRPGSPDALISLPERDLGALLNEELRRLDPDDIYARTLSHLPPTDGAT